MSKKLEKKSEEELKKEFLELCQKYTRQKILSINDSVKAAQITNELQRRKQKQRG